MEYAIGIVLALTVSGFARATGLDRDRAFYPILMMVIASYYVLFAVMGGSMQALLVESIVMVAFMLAAVVGFKRDLRVVVGGLGAHGLFDVFHDLVSTNPGVPGWWPAFCLAFDLGAAVFLASLLIRSKL